MDIWDVRAFVYKHFTDTTHPPSVEGTARHFNISKEEAGKIYKELNNRHAFFLEPGSLTIRMANPFSGIPTDFKVHANGKTYFANCAWDMLGIPAALASRCDAVIEAVFTESNDAVRLEVKNGQITISHNDVTLSRSPERSEGAGEGSLSLKHETLRSQQPLPQSDTQLLVHFPLPFARWYDDLVFT
ncbi:MAG TPA: organomercurial lyase [Anaerolineales bacterium]|nr:organomercurial lyase [Anaerolineales bacterium]